MPVEGSKSHTVVVSCDVCKKPLRSSTEECVDTNRDLKCDKCAAQLECEHSWGEGEVTTAPGCETAGEKTYTCANCGTTKTETVAATGHVNTTKTTVDATCTADGSVTVTCACGEVVSTTVLPATGHNYVNGVCTGCGATENVAKYYTIRVAGKSLMLEGLVSINAKCAFLDENGKSLSEAYILANAGVEFVGVNGEILIVTELERSSQHPDGYYTYVAQSMGIPAKDMDKVITIRPFLIVNGEKIYGEETTYGVLTYVENMMKKSTTSDKLKSTLVGLLNYGAAAQEYFDYKGMYQKPEKLMNDCLKDYVAAGYIDASMLELNWDGSLLDPVVEPVASMTVNFPKTGVVEQNNKIGKSLLLEGAIMINYKVVIGQDDSKFQNATSTLYCWTSTEYAALLAKGEAFTKENASYTVAGEGLVYDPNVGYMAVINSDQIAAKEMGNTQYVVMVIVDDDGIEHCSGVIVYSPEQYAANQTGKSGYLAEMCKWMVTYGERAKINFQ